MKHSLQKLCLLTITCSTALLADAVVTPFLQWRSQGRNTERKLVGTTSHHVYLDDMESFYGTFNATPQYDRSFRSQEITQALFGSSLFATPTAGDAASSSKNSGRALMISGSLTENRNNAKDWMAENFILPRDFQSTISFSPLVQDFLVDFNLYVGLDEWVRGLYFRVYGPVVNNRTNLRAQETVISPGTEGAGSYTQGYFSGQNQVTPDQMFKSALQFFSGSPLIAPIDSITYNPLLFGKITPSHTQSKTGFAELRGEFGWNYLHEDYHFGFNIQSAAPTGKRPHGEFLLEPEIGNGKHWELGIGLSGHWTMWRSEDEERHFDLVLEADITHLFRAKQTRVFDLVGKPNSKYMLAEKLVPNTGSTDHLTGASDAGVEFGNTYSPVANFSARDISVTIGAQGDIIAMLNYTSRGFSWDLGYNFWGMSREKIHLSDNDAFPENTWALKGDASIAGQSSGTGTPTILLAATETGAENNGGGATIHGGTNQSKPNPLTNPNIDNGVPATTGTLGDTNVFQFGTTLPISTSKLPVYIKETNLDLEAAELRGYSNKIYTYLSYTWIDREDWIPYLGIGFNAEFGSHNNNNDNSISAVNNGGSGSGITFALSKWAVLMKGGVSFD